MALLTTGDIPNEILTIYSREAIFAAFPNLYFRQFVKVKNEFQNEPGETVQFLKLGNLPKGGQLASETNPIPKNKYSDSTVSIQVREYGNATQISRRALEASFRPMLQDASVLLGRDYGLVLDEVCRDAFLSVANKQYGGGVAGTANIASGSTFKTSEIKDAVETLKTLNVPMMTRGNDQHYVAIAHPHQLRSLRDDNAWIEAHKYANPENIYNGEAGRYENVVFLETTQMPILPAAGASSQDIYRAVLFGADAVGFGETVPFQLLNDGIEDFGRLVSIAWYSIFGAGVINDYGVEIQTS
jgi:N4-gp56 family major capsid protein